MKKLISMICCVLALTLCLTACGQRAASNEGGQSLAKGGVLVLSVNPEIAVEYDENGTVTGVTARNNDALAIINSCTGLIGQPTREVVTDLVTAIGEAGYFVEEIEGERRQITLEIEPGSSLPNDAFLADVIADIRDAVNQHDWSTPLVVEGESDFGITDYIDTDYGEGNDGFTDYNDTDYGPNNDGVTDYDHHDDDSTDYGEGSDGVTDYDGTDYADNTDYGINADGDTDYDDTDYGPNNDGVTDYSDYGTDSNTNYGDSAYGDSGYQQPAATNPPATSGNTDYDDGQSDYNDSNTNYGDSVYGDSGYEAPAATNPPATSGNTDYDDGQSDYNDSNSNYGDSTYDNNSSNYGDSAYDDGSDFDD